MSASTPPAASYDATVSDATVARLLARVDAQLQTSGPSPRLVLDGDHPAIAGTGLAAVTVSATADQPATLVVDPRVIDAAGEQVTSLLIAHELVHVRLQPQTPSSTPLWVVEGFADLIAYELTGTDTGAIAELAAAGLPGAESPPAEPPSDEQLAARSTRQGAYARAWSLWRTIAAIGGLDGAHAIYIGITEGGQTPDQAVRTVLAVTWDELIGQWTASLEEDTA